MVNIKELHPDSSPQAAFGARLRSSREARGWTQDDLADRMDYSSKHISAIETARRESTLRFARSADAAFGLAGTADSFEREWRELRSGSLLEGFPEYVEYEGRAVEIRLYEVGIIPGLLQTPEYAATLAEADLARGMITPEQASERITLVADRQAALARNPLPQVFVVLDESCIRRPIGPPEVMDAQFSRLIQFAGMPNSVLHVAPFSMGVRRPLNYPVTVLTLPNRSLMSYAESAQHGHLEREMTFVLPMLAAYHQLQAEALSQAESVTMIEQLRKGIP
ncbi:helix-turn-helix domain-containing protein [Actinacidiphila bryophytorum]|uniref:Helix-turn-helix domain-containing protein n=1 Tax=Actinacidiphila bryophytorum TaxID=1436133 RepID=A0A9W4E1A8_9ACTN|nr:helix-turn-helix transcriptional regulator [Actinacidiphila bryophytorum]MBM9439028.1 transcriptional regulator [Actinacidiphila bryophytorum]MBN6544040.1 transcriptional regulator [Actinacidiphila bryophytorum]CAG7597586.1 Helix-turn-helix domain-containing protein [Actinacidiphila bryophytorum]